jgi:hypothetical protein
MTPDLLDVVIERTADHGSSTVTYRLRHHGLLLAVRETSREYAELLALDLAQLLGSAVYEQADGPGGPLALIVDYRQKVDPSRT